MAPEVCRLSGALTGSRVSQRHSWERDGFHKPSPSSFLTHKLWRIPIRIKAGRKHRLWNSRNKVLDLWRVCAVTTKPQSSPKRNTQEQDKYLDPRAVARGIMDALPEDFPAHLRLTVMALYTYSTTRWQRAEQLESGNVKFAGNCSYSQLAKFATGKNGAKKGDAGWKKMQRHCEELRERRMLTWRPIQYGIEFTFCCGDGFRGEFDVAEVTNALGKVDWEDRCPDCHYDGDGNLVDPCLDCHDEMTEPDYGDIELIPEGNRADWEQPWGGGWICDYPCDGDGCKEQAEQELELPINGEMKRLYLCGDCYAEMRPRCQGCNRSSNMHLRGSEKGQFTPLCWPCFYKQSPKQQAACK